ncbi:hypothetical protein [Mesorhizobium sp.]|uniref:hypothetical protein n=1 Tax=Mesorhizobium sp. TaxID=1871066 RepID=UPI000FE6CC4A|nr:hypothetical protein [Mesorhizobium sp.]RWA80831.1 MAG: hypothetical protein EOQ30_21490 [Mesorhizobium sp.]
MKRKAKSIGAASLLALADHGDVAGVYRRAIFMLRQSGDPEFRVLARILSRKAHTGVTVKFVEGRGRKLRAQLPIPTSEGKMSRREIACLVFDLLGKPETGEKIGRGRLKDAVLAVVIKLGIEETIVRRCFHEYRVSLAASAAFPELVKRTVK